jgi:hypothetical protein
MLPLSILRHLQVHLAINEVEVVGWLVKAIGSSASYLSIVQQNAILGIHLLFSPICLCIGLHWFAF